MPTRNLPKREITLMRQELKSWGFRDVDEMPDYVVVNEHSAESIDRYLRRKVKSGKE